MTLVTRKAPEFSAPAAINGNETVDNFSLQQYLGSKYVLFFFYPKDFTFVCPSELIAFQAKLAEFEKRDVAVVGCSTDTEQTHLAWLNTEKNNGGIKGITYPLVADVDKTIATNFGVLAGEYDYNEAGQLAFNGIPVALRGTFLIDKEGIVRHGSVNDLPLGRSIDEFLRLVDALQFTEEHGEVCPANWKEGEDGMVATADGVADYLTKH
jgi:peroxiredoxin (alkyl hydroperoxide reductase subunit C)